jgi:hypothetical protein
MYSSNPVLVAQFLGLFAIFLALGIAHFSFGFLLYVCDVG